MNTEHDIQVVEFGIGEEIFAVPVGLVREILDYNSPFQVPGGPGYFLGLTDVRGQGVPTVDLRVRLGLVPAEPTLATRILVLDIPLGERTLSLCVVIDRVLSVASIATCQIETAPDIGVRWNSDYITGVVRKDGSFVVIMDIAKVFTEVDMPQLVRAAA